MRKNVTFISENNKELSGVLHRPDIGLPKAYIIFAHCFTCTKDINAAANIAKQLSAHGYGVLRFDFEGIGKSEGAFEDTSFSSNITDLISANKFITQSYDAPQILIGHSLGGTAVLAASRAMPNIKAVATIGSPASPDHVLHVLDGHLERLENEGETVIPIAGRDLRFRQSFVEDVMGHVSDYSGLDKALMVMHSPIDNIVSIDEASKIFSQARHPKSFVSLGQADHLLSRKQDAQNTANILASWAEKYIDPAQNIPDAPNKIENGVIVSGETDQMFLNTALAGRHAFIVDEPLSYGGSDLGPTPYDYLGVALGSCTSMTLNGYARRKKLNVSSVSVRVVHERIHAQDCEACEKSEGKVDQFTRYIHIKGDITESQRNRMLQIADLCPVHKTLENEIKINTELEN